MKILQKSDALASLILGEQKINDMHIYRVSPFVMILKYANVFLLFNNLNKKYISLTYNEFLEMNLKYEISGERVLISEFTYRQSKIIDLLIKDYFFVPTGLDMIKLSDNLRSTILLMQKTDNDIYSYVIFTTTACNARCFYCFEAGIETQTMTVQTAEELAKYILSHSGDKKIYLRWFGGEPLCNIQAIDTICHELSEKGRQFRSEIITNGYLLNEEIIAKAKNNWNFDSFQITLDGRKEVYNKVKNYKNGDPNAYERVLNNIELILKNDMFVEIRLNMDLYNADELEALIHEISPRFNKYKKVCIYVRPIYENIRSCNNTHSDYEREQITKRYMQLEKIISSYDIQRKPDLTKHIRLYSCMADEPFTYVVSPNGKFGYCEHYPLERHFGSLWDNNLRGVFSSYSPALDKCSECVAYPTCLRLLDCHDGRNECLEYEHLMRINPIKTGMLKKYLNNRYNTGDG